MLAIETPAATEKSNSRPLTLRMLVVPKAIVMPVAPLLRAILGGVVAAPALEVTVPFMAIAWPPGALSVPPLVGNASVMPLANVAPAEKITLPVVPASPTVNVPAVTTECRRERRRARAALRTELSRPSS